jgi:thymidylate synthase (FAD)
MKIARQRVTLIAHTTFMAPMQVPWLGDAGARQSDTLAEFSGRACYQSWNKPNPATATNDGYLRHILEVSHLSVLEHANATFYIEGVSRSLTHELVRHRHFSYSQLSQRYVGGTNLAYVIPPEMRDDPELLESLETEMWNDEQTYAGWTEHLDKKLGFIGEATERRKRARQTARSVLANAVETKIVMTGNMRAWRHFVRMRASQAADVEIRELAVEILRQLKVLAPATFQDVAIEKLEDGTEVAHAALGVEME